MGSSGRARGIYRTAQGMPLRFEPTALHWKPAREELSLPVAMSHELQNHEMAEIERHIEFALLERRFSGGAGHMSRGACALAQPPGRLVPHQFERRHAPRGPAGSQHDRGQQGGEHAGEIRRHAVCLIGVHEPWHDRQNGSRPEQGQRRAPDSELFDSEMKGRRYLQKKQPPQARLNTRVPFVPPNPKLFFTAYSIFICRASLAQ